MGFFDKKDDHVDETVEGLEEVQEESTLGDDFFKSGDEGEGEDFSYGGFNSEEHENREYNFAPREEKAEDHNDVLDAPLFEEEEAPVEQAPIEEEFVAPEHEEAPVEEHHVEEAPQHEEVAHEGVEEHHAEPVEEFAPITEEPAVEEHHEEVHEDVAHEEAHYVAPVAEETPEVREEAQNSVSLLSRAQQLHDEYIREGENARAQALAEAEEIRSNAVAEAEREAHAIQARIEELKTFENEYRARVKALSDHVLKALEEE